MSGTSNSNEYLVPIHIDPVMDPDQQPCFLTFFIKGRAESRASSKIDFRDLSSHMTALALLKERPLWNILHCSLMLQANGSFSSSPPVNQPLFTAALRPRYNFILSSLLCLHFMRPLAGCPTNLKGLSHEMDLAFDDMYD
jgi:hypothetical protein